LVLVSGLIVGVLGCSTAQGDSEADGAVDSTVAGKVVNVQVEPLQPTTFTDFISITGDVEAFHDATVSAEESGVIKEFLLEKGSPVRKGQVIARLDDEVLGAQVSEARAAAELAREQYERQRRLWEDERIGSEIAYLQAKAQAAVQEARLATLEARLARTEIRAPVSGVFDEQFLEEGEMASVGTPVVRVVATHLLKIVGGVPERFAPWVQPGDNAVISFDILPGRQLEGTIAFVGSSVDDRNRTFPVEIVIENPDRVVKPEMLANVQLERLRLTDVIVVPQQIVKRTEFGYRVHVVVERNGATYASAREVVLGPEYSDRVVVEQGLAAGDRLITAGALLVDDGSRVRIVESAAREGSGV
jgi:membrane fusion protein (multidrug efflux system)